MLTNLFFKGNKPVPNSRNPQEDYFLRPTGKLSRSECEVLSQQTPTKKLLGSFNPILMSHPHRPWNMMTDPALLVPSRTTQ
jgi:hypothetical protein